MFKIAKIVPYMGFKNVPIATVQIINSLIKYINKNEIKIVATLL